VKKLVEIWLTGSKTELNQFAKENFSFKRLQIAPTNNMKWEALDQQIIPCFQDILVDMSSKSYNPKTTYLFDVNGPEYLTPIEPIFLKIICPNCAILTGINNPTKWKHLTNCLKPNLKSIHLFFFRMAC